MSSGQASGSNSIDRLLDRSRYAGPRVGWDDIVGHDAGKRELAVVAETIRRSDTAENLGVPLVKGLLIWGAPGTGKSMLAKALASTIERPAYVIPSAEMTPVRLRRLYERLATQPSVIVFDEAEVIVGDRHWSSDKLAAAFCAAIDGVNSVSGPITIALTARSERSLDQSATRAGRLTTKVHVAHPTESERTELWSRATSRVPLLEAIDVPAIAARTDGMTGADIEATVLVALGLSMVDGSDGLTAAVLNEAIERDHRVDEAPRPLPVRPEDQWRDAIHEAGHVAIAVHTLGPSSVTEVQLAIGHVRGSHASFRFPPVPATLSTVRIRAQIALAGTVMEALEFGAEHASIGSDGDIADATSQVHALVAESGGSAALGLITVSRFGEDLPAEAGALIWHEVRREIERARSTADAYLVANIDQVRAFARTLHDSPDRRLEGPALHAAIADCFGLSELAVVEQDVTREDAISLVLD